METNGESKQQGAKSHSCIIGFGHSSTETNGLSQPGTATAPHHCKYLRAGTVCACACVQLLANGLGRGCYQDSKPWGCAAIRHQLFHTRLKQTYLSHQSVLQDGEDISSLSGFPCPPLHSQGNPMETSRG